MSTALLLSLLLYLSGVLLTHSMIICPPKCLYKLSLPVTYDTDGVDQNNTCETSVALGMAGCTMYSLTSYVEVELVCFCCSHGAGSQGAFPRPKLSLGLVIAKLS